MPTGNQCLSSVEKIMHFFVVFSFKHFFLIHCNRYLFFNTVYDMSSFLFYLLYFVVIMYSVTLYLVLV